MSEHGRADNGRTNICRRLGWGGRGRGSPDFFHVAYVFRARLPLAQQIQRAPIPSVFTVTGRSPESHRLVGECGCVIVVNRLHPDEEMMIDG